jgi:16S rRNA (guanine966-N2)-methyltransferase
VRIIAGSLKGRTLESPAWPGLRPTSDKLRETLFNIVAPRIAGARVLDAYAGTGAVGIEALSRGAAHVTFVESDRRAQALIARNLAHCAIENGYVIIRRAVVHALDTLRREPPFDLVFLDPPYDELAVSGVASLEAVGPNLAPGGLAVVEHARREAPPTGAGSLRLARVVRSGDSALAFYSCQP